MAFLLLSITLVAVLAMGWGIAFAGDPPEANVPEGTVPSPSAAGEILLVDTGGSWFSVTYDCAPDYEGWGDDWWTLTLTSARDVSVRVKDCCIVGDYYEVHVDDCIIGITPDPGYPSSGPLSDGTFTVSLQPGTYSIKVRDALFQSTDPPITGMCPAGYTVWISLGDYTGIPWPCLPTIEELAARVAALEEKLHGEVQPRLDALEAKDIELESRIAALEAAVAALQAADAAMQAEIDALQAADSCTQTLLDWLIEHVIPRGLINQAEKKGNPMPECP
jgi:hypothetical protein